MTKKKINGRAWKFISIIFIVLFAFVVLGGLWRAYHFRPHLETATADQIDVAKTVALTDLNARGENTANYYFKVSDKIRRLPFNPDQSNASSVLEVIVYNDSVHNTYIIDINSSTILMYSKTEFYDGLNHSLNHSIDRFDKGPGPDDRRDFFKYSR